MNKGILYLCRCAAVQVEFYDKGSQKIDEAKNEDRKIKLQKMEK